MPQTHRTRMTGTTRNDSHGSRNRADSVRGRRSPPQQKAQSERELNPYLSTKLHKSFTIGADGRKLNTTTHERTTSPALSPLPRSDLSQDRVGMTTPLIVPSRQVGRNFPLLPQTPPLTVRGVTLKHRRTYNGVRNEPTNADPNSFKSTSPKIQRSNDRP